MSETRSIEHVVYEGEVIDIHERFPFLFDGIGSWGEGRSEGEKSGREQMETLGVFLLSRFPFSRRRSEYADEVVLAVKL